VDCYHTDHVTPLFSFLQTSTHLLWILPCIPLFTPKFMQLMIHLSGMLPHLHIFLYFSLSFPCNTPFCYNHHDPIYSYFSSPYHMPVRAILSLLDKFLSFQLFPSHVVDYLTAMCSPHGFIVTDRDCPQPIVTFVGNQRWSVHCALLVYSPSPLPEDSPA
jgi:hypothetical protein